MTSTTFLKWFPLCSLSDKHLILIEKVWFNLLVLYPFMLLKDKFVLLHIKPYNEDIYDHLQVVQQKYYERCSYMSRSSLLTSPLAEHSGKQRRLGAFQVLRQSIEKGHGFEDETIAKCLVVFHRVTTLKHKVANKQSISQKRLFVCFLEQLFPG